MADRDYDSSRHRRRSPHLYAPAAPAPSGFASAHRPTLPPLTTSPPPRGMPSASPGYRQQSPPRYDDPMAYSTQATVWAERQPEPRGLPSQPAAAWPAYTTPGHYDTRYPGQQQSYYPPQQQSSHDVQRSRLPPLSTSGLQAHEGTHPSSSYLPNPSAVRSPMASYSSPSYSLESARTPRPAYASQHQAYPAPHISSSSSRHQSAAYGHTHSAQSHTMPFAAADSWGASLAPEHTHTHVHSHARHEQAYPTQSTAAYSSYSHQDRESETWNPELSPTSERAPDEPLIKKKRKRADANQLRVLNATYQRTAFPSTQERESLAKELDMSPRSVQIWFQNKRQSMRQSRNAANNLPPILHHAYPSSSTDPRPTHQTYHALSAEASSSRRRDDTPPGEHRRRS
ncbi:homeobox-domain-containing protein [Ramaria rubella]|nr:homeobox-domain-containing protein [Ramaria rubella]